MHHNISQFDFYGAGLKTRDSIPQDALVYSQPTKRPWRRMEHVYVEIGPPELPTRGYKNDPSEDLYCQGQHDAINGAVTKYGLWMQCKYIAMLH